MIALDLSSGKLLWQAEEVPLNLTPDDARGWIYVSGLQSISAFSVMDGKKLWANVSEQFDHNGHEVKLQADGQLVVDIQGGWYIDPSTGILSKEPVELRDSNLEFHATIDDNANKLLFHTSDYSVISNTARGNDIIAVLDSDARLHLINGKNGVGVGIIDFEQPKHSGHLYEPGAIGGSWIVIDENYLAIYFQDTDILSVYSVDWSKLHS